MINSFIDQLTSEYGLELGKQLNSQVEGLISEGTDPQQAFEMVVMEYEDNHWDCERCGKKRQKVISRHVVNRADPTQVLKLECGHVLF